MIEIVQNLVEDLVPSAVWWLAILLGAWTLLTYFWNLFYFCYSTLIRKPCDLQSRYGKNTWALITGSSEGIGKQFAMHLAMCNFNIILTARTENKLIETQKQIQTACPNIQIRYICLDFIKFAGEKQSQSSWYLDNKLDKLDISIVVNNAGIGICKKFERTPSEDLMQMVRLNCLFLNSMHFTFLERFNREIESAKPNRKLHRLIVNLSSISAQTPTAFLSVYSATKSYVDKLTRGTQLENPAVDMMSFRPATVTTRMTGYNKDSFCVSPKSSVGSLMRRDIGFEVESNGHWQHVLQSLMGKLLPESITTKRWKAYIEKKKSQSQKQN